MSTRSNRCFICGNPTVIHYDFLAVEHAVQSGKDSTLVNMRLAGFARMPLCGECLQKRVSAYIAANTKKNGTPLFMMKREVTLWREFLAKMQQGNYENSDLMRRLFIRTLTAMNRPDTVKYDKNCNMSQGDLGSLGGPDFIYFDSRIEPEYVLLSLGQSATVTQEPFTQPIVRSANMFDSSFRMHFAFRMDKAKVLYELEKEIPNLQMLYQSRLENI